MGGSVVQTRRNTWLTVAASKRNPEFIVETDNGSRAAHTAGALKKDGS
jgi:hypothetical protein